MSIAQAYYRVRIAIVKDDLARTLAANHPFRAADVVALNKYVHWLRRRERKAVPE